MILSSWLASMHLSSRRGTRTVARRNRSYGFNRGPTFELLEDRRLLSTVQFVTDHETFDAGGAEFSLPVALSNIVSTIGFDWPGPVGLAVDSTGNLYVDQSNDAGTVSKVTPGGTISTFASGIQNSQTSAGDLAFDKSGNLFIANPGANAVNVVTPGDVISTFAKGLNDAFGLAFDSADNLYVSDASGNTVSKVDIHGNVKPFASGLDFPTGLAVDSVGNVYVCNSAGTTVSELSPAGDVIKVLTGFNQPDALAFDSAGDLYVANVGNGTVTEVPPGDTEPTSTVVDGLSKPDGLAFDSAGNLYVAEYGNGGVSGAVSKFNAPVTVQFTISGSAAANVDYISIMASPLTIGIGQNGQFINFELPADPGPSKTMTVTLGTPTGGANLGNPFVNTLTITEPPTVQFSAGSETVNETAGTFSIPVTLSGAFDQSLTVPFELSDTAAAETAVSDVTASPLSFPPGTTTEDITGTLVSDPGASQTLTFSLGAPQVIGAVGNPSVNTLTITEPGRVQFDTGSETIDESAGTFVVPVSLSATPTVSSLADGFNQPDGVAFDGGDLYVSDLGTGTVIKVTPEGQKSTFASGFQNPVGLAFDATGNLYVANSVDNSVIMVTPKGTMTTFASGFNTPFGLAFDGGNLYVSDVGDDTVSKVTSAGLSTFASGFDVPTALGFDSAGNLYVVNAGNNTVTKVTPTGQKSTFASGFNQPVGLTVDPAGDLYVANLGDNTVSEVTAAGSISTLASGLSSPFGLAFDSARNLYVANDGNNTVSEVSETVTVPFALSGAAAAGVAFSGLTAGPLMFGIGQTTQFIAGTLLSDPGATQTLTFTLGTPAGGAVLGSPAVNTLTINEPTAVGTPTPTPTSLTPVFKGEQRVFSGKGKHKKLVGFEFLFNGALNPSGAESTGNYHVTQKQGKKVKVLRVKSALYNPSDFSVTISVGGFNTGKPAQAAIAGLAAADGEAIPLITSGL